MGKENKPKINRQDIKVVKHQREVDAYLMPDGTKYWADRVNIDTLATHDNCSVCSIEFEKTYTYSRMCFNCERKKENDNFQKLELVEWDGKVPLCVFCDDTYFFDEDSILQYCEDNEITPEQLKLVVCKQTSFGSIDLCEMLQDDVHEDWEPDKSLTEIQNTLDNYLRTANTNTWIASDKRVLLDLKP